jgi:hypothetical protein
MHLMSSTGCIFYNIYQCGCCHKVPRRMQTFYAIKNAVLGDMIKGTSDTVPPRQSFSDLTTDAVTTVICVSRQSSGVRMRNEWVGLEWTGVRRLILINTRSHKNLKMCETVNLCSLFCLGFVLGLSFHTKDETLDVFFEQGTKGWEEGLC